MRRVLVVLTASVLLASLIASCSTMAAYEKARLERVAKAQGKQVPAPSPSAQGGTLVQPYIPPKPVDSMAIAASKSAAAAQASAEANDTSLITGQAAGPMMPVLKVTLTSKSDIETVASAYDAYAKAVDQVRVSVIAFGLEKNLKGIERVRNAGDFWEKYFAAMRIRPPDKSLSASDVQAFYDGLKENGTIALDAISAINDYIDTQSSRPPQAATDSDQ